MTAGMTGKVLGSFMGKGFFRRKVDTVLGVDINDSGIKLIELGRSIRRFQRPGLRYANAAAPGGGGRHLAGP